MWIKEWKVRVERYISSFWNVIHLVSVIQCATYHGYSNPTKIWIYDFPFFFLNVSLEDSMRSFLRVKPESPIGQLMVIVSLSFLHTLQASAEKVRGQTAISYIDERCRNSLQRWWRNDWIIASYWFATTFVSPDLSYWGVKAMKFGTLFFFFFFGVWQRK